MDVYVTDVSAYLPGDAVGNDEIEKYLGHVENVPANIKRIVLKSNGIKSRYYAIDPLTGRASHTTARLAAEAIRRLSPYDGFSLTDIECLCCGTASPDLLVPGHGLMVHGELGTPPTEVVTTSGICLSGMSALKYAFMNVALGLVCNAVASGADRGSASVSERSYKDVTIQYEASEGKDGLIPFDTAFLRWMLSDGAGAVFLTGQRPGDRDSLRIDWIEHMSFAGELEPCMYHGAAKRPDGSMKYWREYESLADAVADGALFLKQDIKLLSREIINVGVRRALTMAIRKHNLSASQIDWFLPHLSSEFFRAAFYQSLKEIGFEIPAEKWFTNLPYKGNTGSASIYIIMEELYHSNMLRKGQKILCVIPESGRFSMCYMMLTVV